MERTHDAVEIPLVDNWRIKKGVVDKKGDPVIDIDSSDAYVYPDGDCIRMNFAKMFALKTQLMLEEDEATKQLETFTIKREAYINKINIICQYVDYFIEFFDPDKELPMVYLHMKDLIDNEKFSMTPVEFLNLLVRQFVLQSSIKDHIYDFVDYNNHIDVTVDPKTGRQFVESDDFTNEDARRLLAISMAMKLTIPLVEQYKATSEVYKAGSWATDIIADTMVELFYQFGHPPKARGTDIVWERKKIRVNRPKKPWERRLEEKKQEEPEVDETDDLMKKVYKFINKRVKKHKKNNSPIWGQQEALRGLTEAKKEDELLSKYIFYDNFFKLNFLHSIVSLMQSIVETQLRFTVIAVKYKKNPVEVNTTPDANGLSSRDKVEQSLPKIDETLAIRVDIATEDVLNRIVEEVGPISEEEIEYYRTHCVRNKEGLVQDTLLQNFFAKRYGGFTELKTMPDRYQIMLLIALKRMLEKKGDRMMSYFMSATTVGKTSNRLLQNAKYINKLKSSPTYKRLTEKKYKVFYGEEDQPDIVLVPISKALNNQYTFVEYGAPELYGQRIQFDEDIISNEIMDLLDAV
ncbi:MAG: hypothetical protein NC548_29625 [Lachnospiraceae bacterium]|nr:hypothetical protein [Lachnospiraceae bacterium]